MSIVEYIIRVRSNLICFIRLTSGNWLGRATVEMGITDSAWFETFAAIQFNSGMDFRGFSVLSRLHTSLFG